MDAEQQVEEVVLLNGKRARPTMTHTLPTVNDDVFKTVPVAEKRWQCFLFGGRQLRRLSFSGTFLKLTTPKILLHRELIDFRTYQPTSQLHKSYKHAKGADAIQAHLINNIPSNHASLISSGTA
ncbi:hypothetical protein K5D38_22065 [Pseudomonas cichorii]|nr:hypothetical protein [Pseudomonas cichorii]